MTPSFPLTDALQKTSTGWSHRNCVLKVPRVRKIVLEALDLFIRFKELSVQLQGGQSESFL